MTRSPVLAAAAAVISMLLCSGSALAIYTWVDEKGQTHITDYPKPGKPAEPASVKTEKDNVSAVPALPKPALKADQPQPAGEARQPSNTAAPVPALPKNEQPIAQSSPGQLRLNAVSSQSATPVASTSQPVAGASSISPQVIPLNKNAPGAKTQNNGAIQMIKMFISMFFYFLLFAYLYFSLCLYLIARKLNVSSAWIAWVPLFQIATLLESASKPLWWALLFFVPIVNLVIPIYVWMCISENLGKSKWLGLLMLVPVANLVFIGVLAFSGQGSHNDVNVAVS